MINVREMARAHYSTEQELEAFMDGFTKQAAAGPAAAAAKSAWYMSGDRNVLLENGAKVGLGLAGALGGALIVKGISSGYTAYANSGLRTNFEKALNTVVASNKVVKSASPEKARQYAETLFKFAPHVAADPNLLSSILANAVLGEGIDPQTIKTLVDLEGRYLDNTSTSALPGIKA